MEFDIDSAVAAADAQAALIPWDLSVRIAGVSYRVRPLTNADLMKLARLGVVEQAREVAPAIEALFDTPRPSLAALSERQLEAVLVAIGAGFRDHVKKKSLTLKAAVDLQLRAGGVATSESAEAPTAADSPTPR